MGKIPPEFLQKIKEAVNITEVIGEHVVLRKQGANYVGLCPFHSERSPSFSVHEGKGLYHCYGCKKSGDIVTFTIEIHGISFPEAVEELAERARIPLPLDWGGGPSSDDPETQRRRAEAREKQHILFKVNLFAMAFYRQQLGHCLLAEQYFRKRGVHGDLAKNFRVGAAPPAWDALSRHMTEKKAPLAQAVELGLIRPSTKHPGEYFDLFRNRAMFPIIDMRGRVAGFGGRTMPLPEGAPEVGGAADPKYMNSPESQIFLKSKLAFGLFQAQKHVREKDEIILVEGYFDVLALHAAGFENVVATCGTSLTPEHLTLFKRFAKRVTVLFDGDKAGVSATERAMEVGLDFGQILHGAAMPEGMDPDELLFDQETGQPLAEGKERMASLLASGQPLLASQLQNQFKASTQGPEARTQALKKAASWLTRYKDPVGREVWIEEVARGLGVSRGLLVQAMGGSAGPAPVQKPVPKYKIQLQSPPKRLAHLSQGEKLLLQGLALGEKFADLFAAAQDLLPKESTLVDLFDYPGARELIQELVSRPGGPEKFRTVSEAVFNEEMDPQVRSILTEAVVGRESILASEDFKISLDRAIGRNWARFSQHIKTALADAEAKQDAGLHAELMKEYLDVQRKIKEFISFYDEA